MSQDVKVCSVAVANTDQPYADQDVVGGVYRLVGAVGPQWGLPHCGEIVTTINAVGVFVGALIGVSQLTAAKADEDGQ